MDNFQPYCVRCSQAVTVGTSESEGFLLSCMHFVCRSCAESCESGQCPVCCDPNVAAVPLKSPPSDVAMYLQPPSQLLSTLGEVWSFQANHYAGVMQQASKTVAEAMSLIPDLQSQVDQIRTAYEAEKSRRESLEEEAEGLRRSLSAAMTRQQQIEAQQRQHHQPTHSQHFPPPQSQHSTQSQQKDGSSNNEVLEKLKGYFSRPAEAAPSSGDMLPRQQPPSSRPPPGNPSSNVPRPLSRGRPSSAAGNTSSPSRDRRFQANNRKSSDMQRRPDSSGRPLSAGRPGSSGRPGSANRPYSGGSQRPGSASSDGGTSIRMSTPPSTPSSSAPHGYSTPMAHPPPTPLSAVIGQQQNRGVSSGHLTLASPVQRLRTPQTFVGKGESNLRRPPSQPPIAIQHRGGGEGDRGPPRGRGGGTSW